MTHRALRNLVYAYYKEHGRHTLPWRKTTNPYRILVSEVMLQQTQVDRVIPYYKAFLKRFPTADVLAQAPLSDVLVLWQGLGYNRRAKMLHDAAKGIVSRYQGRFPKTEVELVALPGVGPYTARAIRAFAYNEDVVLLETNVRTVLLHHLYSGDTAIKDTELLEVLAACMPKGDARNWYSALMDYGSHLKRSGVKTNTQSAHYQKQRTFKGSKREMRGAILRTLAQGPRTSAEILKAFESERKVDAKEQLMKLEVEGLIEKDGKFYRLPS